MIDKVRDLVGLDVNPPDAALVLFVSEATHVQALDRTTPIPSMLPGVPEQRPHDAPKPVGCLRWDRSTGLSGLDPRQGGVATILVP